MFVNKDLTSASYDLLRPLVEAMPSRGIMMTGNIEYGVKNPNLPFAWWWQQGLLFGWNKFKTLVLTFTIKKTKQCQIVQTRRSRGVKQNPIQDRDHNTYPFTR